MEKIYFCEITTGGWCFCRDIRGNHQWKNPAPLILFKWPSSSSKTLIWIFTSSIAFAYVLFALIFLVLWSSFSFLNSWKDNFVIVLVGFSVEPSSNQSGIVIKFDNLDQNKPRANRCSNFRSRDLILGKASWIQYGGRCGDVFRNRKEYCRDSNSCTWQFFITDISQ